MARSGRATTLKALGALAVLALVTAPVAEAGFRTVPGKTERSGPGKLFRYVVKVERSIRTNPTGFANDVQAVLFADSGWGGAGVAFQQAGRRHDTEILLATPRTVDRLCHPLPTNGTYSCTTGNRLVLNVRRWRNAVAHWPAGRANYRRYLVNHEMGHRLGLGHRGCPGSGKRAPVMLQQSISLQGCRAGWWPRRSELRAVRQLHG